MKPSQLETLSQIWTAEYGYSNLVQMPDGQYACVCRLMFTHAVLYGLQDWGYLDRWCYKDYVSALGALNDWKKNWANMEEPAGWHRHPASGRRIDETGKEEIRL